MTTKIRTSIIFLSLTLSIQLLAKPAKFYVYDQQTRTAILKSLWQAMKVNYSLWDIKSQKPKNFSGDKAFETNNAVSSDQFTISIFSPCNSFTTA